MEVKAARSRSPRPQLYRKDTLSLSLSLSFSLSLFLTYSCLCCGLVYFPAPAERSSRSLPNACFSDPCPPQAQQNYNCVIHLGPGRSKGKALSRIVPMMWPGISFDANFPHWSGPLIFTAPLNEYPEALPG